MNIQEIRQHDMRVYLQRGKPPVPILATGDCPRCKTDKWVISNGSERTCVRCQLRWFTKCAHSVPKIDADLAEIGDNKNIARWLINHAAWRVKQMSAVWHNQKEQNK